MHPLQIRRSVVSYLCLHYTCRRFCCIQWNLWIKDKLGARLLSVVERLSLSQRFSFFSSTQKLFDSIIKWVWLPVCTLFWGNNFELKHTTEYRGCPVLGVSVIRGSTVFSESELLKKKRHKYLSQLHKTVLFLSLSEVHHEYKVRYQKNIFCVLHTRKS